MLPRRPYDAFKCPHIHSLHISIPPHLSPFGTPHPHSRGSFGHSVQSRFRTLILYSLEGIPRLLITGVPSDDRLSSFSLESGTEVPVFRPNPDILFPFNQA